MSRGTVASWPEASKDVISAAIGERSRVWFSVARGRLTEVFYPSPDRAIVHSFHCFVAHADGRVLDETEWAHEYQRPHLNVPLVRMTNAAQDEEIGIEKEIIVDPRSDVVLQRLRFTGDTEARLVCCMRPALENAFEATASVIEHNGARMLVAERHGQAVALACNHPWRACGVADIEHRGSADVVRRRAFRSHASGDVGLFGELEARDCVLALAFAHSAHEAAHAALGALARGYDSIRHDFVTQWQDWTATHDGGLKGALWPQSIAVLKTLEAKRVDGGRVGALSTPWGPQHGPGISGSYHVAWTRDLVHCMGGLLAAGIGDEARQTLVFLQTTQHPDGHWPQNMMLDGQRVWTREELDEAAAPILLVDLLERERAIDGNDLGRTWPMVARAAEHLMRTGPSTARDRWEDTSGVTPYTIASEIAGLACAARLADQLGHAEVGRACREVARHWNRQLDPLLYRRGGPLAKRLQIEGYYVRARRLGDDFAALDGDALPPTELGVDALALVRFGLRDANDPRIRNTVRAIDALLLTELPIGPTWRRYVGDQYGEHADGAPFDGQGIGRPWPLLVGERAHYELARGDRERAAELLHVMERCASATGMLPEQIWDARDVPERRLFTCRPTGSAAPLGWAHSEYVKLCRSLADGRVFDLPGSAP